jgi:hypothetical protein
VVVVWAEAETALVALGMVAAVVRARGTARVARVAEVAVAARAAVVTVGTVVVSVAQGNQVGVVRAAAARAAVARVVVVREVELPGAKERERSSGQSKGDQLY